MNPGLTLFTIQITMSSRQNERKTKVVGSGHGMFNVKHSQPIGDHPLTDTLFLHIAWKYKPSQPIEDHFGHVHCGYS